MSDFFFPPRIIWLRYAPPREGGEPAWRFSGGASQATGEQITTPCCYSSPARRRSVLNCVSHAGGRLQPGCFCGTERGASQGGRSRFRQIRDVRLPTACCLLPSASVCCAPLLQLRSGLSHVPACASAPLSGSHAGAEDGIRAWDWRGCLSMRMPQ